jgi:hypothetical protein
MHCIYCDLKEFIEIGFNKLFFYDNIQEKALLEL